MKKDGLILVAQPSMSNYTFSLLFFWLVLPLIAVLWSRASLKLLVYEDRVILEKGVLSKRYVEIFSRDIRAVFVRRGFLQRMSGTGDVGIATSATRGMEQVAYGLKDPERIKNIILEQKKKYQQHTQTEQANFTPA